MASLPIIKPGKVILNGENPFIWLSETKEGLKTTEASIWTITYSEKGAGHALFIKSELTDNQWRIYSDNHEMARWLQSTVQGMLNPETAATSIPIYTAQFSREGDVTNSWSQIVTSEHDEIIMTWHKIKHPILVQDDMISKPIKPYGVSAIMMPAISAKVTINEKKARGQVWPMDLNGYPFNTAALAFSESWRVPEN